MELRPIVECRAGDVLRPEQIAAIGQIAAEWGMLEFALMAHGQNICRVFPGLAFSILTGNPGGKVLAERLAMLAPTFLSSEIASTFQDILKAVSALGDRRNDIVHGVWNLTPAIIGRMTPPGVPPENALNVARKKRGAKVDQVVVSTAELEGIAEQIAGTRLALNRLLHPLPFPVGVDLTLSTLSSS